MRKAVIAASGFLMMVLAACGGQGGAPLANPANFTAEALSGGVALSWDEVENATYTLERKTGDEAYAEIAAPTQTSYLDEAVGAGTSYTYRLRAVRGGQRSSGVEVSVTTLTEPGTQTVVATGLNGPLGVLVADDGTVYAIDSGLGGDEVLGAVPDPETGEETPITFGLTARIVQVAPDGAQTDLIALPSVALGGEGLGGNRLALVDGTLYASLGDWDASLEEPPFNLERVDETFGSLVRIEGDEISLVADTYAFEISEDPDGLGDDPNEDGRHSHPYDLAVSPTGTLYLTDAGGNSLLEVDPETGAITLLAAFEKLELPNPETGETDEVQFVPTGVAVGEDGTLYVSSFYNGVVQLAPDGSVSPYTQDVGLITDLQAGPDGELYAVQLAEFGEQGPAPESGKIIRVGANNTSEIVVDGLSFPTALDFSAGGDGYVTLSGAGPDAGQVVRIEGLTTLAAP